MIQQKSTASTLATAANDNLSLAETIRRMTLLARAGKLSRHLRRVRYAAACGVLNMMENYGS